MIYLPLVEKVLPSYKSKETYIKIQCDQCGVDSWKRKQWYLRRQKKLTHFCSRTCSNEYQRAHSNKIQQPCDNCGKLIRVVAAKAKKSKTKLHFCSRVCRAESQRHTGKMYLKQSGTVYKHTSSSYRRKAYAYYGKACSHCGYHEHEAALDIHHIDEDRSNNSVDNLIVLCPTCHALVTRGLAIIKNRILVIKR